MTASSGLSLIALPCQTEKVHLSSWHPVFSSGHPVFSSRHPVFSSRHPVFSSRHPVFSSRHPVFSSRHPVFSSRQPVFSSWHPVFSSRLGSLHFADTSLRRAGFGRRIMPIWNILLRALLYATLRRELLQSGYVPACLYWPVGQYWWRGVKPPIRG